MDVSFNWAPTSFQQWHERFHHALHNLNSARGDVNLDDERGNGNERVAGDILLSALDSIDPDVDMVEVVNTPQYVNPDEDVELLMFALPHHQVNKMT